MAPPGRSRRDLAESIAARFGGSCHPVFHPQSEPSKVPGRPVFHNLTLGFDVLDRDGRPLARCLDDLTLQADLDRTRPPLPGWYRITSDDRRLLHLVQQHADPAASLNELLQPIARLFGTVLVSGPGGMTKVEDRSGASVAIAAPLPGERERPCELITSPLESGDYHHLDIMLELARELNFGLPREGATHLHFEASALRSARSMAHLVRSLHGERARLRDLLGTNPHCIRLGDWPEALLTTVHTPDFAQLSWEEARRRLLQTGLSKYCDFNLLNCLRHPRTPDTVEIRILPSTLVSEPIWKAAELFESFFKTAQTQAS